MARDAHQYAEDYQVSHSEASRRLELQWPLGKLNTALETNERATFAGAWLQHQPDFRFIVQLNIDEPAIIDQYIRGGPLEELVDLKVVAWSLDELERDQRAAMRALLHLDIDFESYINVIDGRVEVHVTNLDTARAQIESSSTALPASTLLVEVDRLTAPDNMRAGLALTPCTSGFTVRDSTGTQGVTTAAHCGSPVYHGPNLLPLQGQWHGSAYDVQWHTAPGYTIRSQYFDGTANRLVTGIKVRADQFINEYVCKYGKNGGYRCGHIISKSSQGAVPNSTPTWIRVSGTSLAQGGDSGGPWFSGGVAYGIHHGSNPDSATYMAIDFIYNLGLTPNVNCSPSGC